jgi:hypothetical protein
VELFPLEHAGPNAIAPPTRKVSARELLNMSIVGHLPHGETHRPPVQGIGLQQSLVVEQSWPYWAQAGTPESTGGGGPPSTGAASGELPSGGGELPSGRGELPSGDVPASGGGGGGPPSMHGPQMPLAAPATTMQLSPWQQSAVTVQPPQLATHAGPPSTGLW